MLKKILIFCFFTLLIGGIYVYPDIRFILEEGKDFKGITLTGAGDEAFYLAKLNAVYKGDYRISSVGLYEHRKDVCLIPPFYEIAMGLTGKNLKIPVPYLDIILSFVFPVIIFWLVYLLCYSLCGSGLFGLLGASGVLMGYSVFTVDPALIGKIIRLDYSEPLWFLRPYSPQLIYIPFLLLLVLIFKYADKKAGVAKILLLGVLMALMNYLHPYLWMFLFAGMAVWLLTGIIKKQTIIIRNITFILSLSLVFSIPYWINCYNMSLSQDFGFYQLLFGAESSRRLILPVSYLLPAAVVLILNIRSERKVFFFLLSFSAGGLLCLNQQVITGKIVQPIYFLNYAGKTFLIAALAASAGIIGKYAKRPVGALAVFLTAILFFLGITQQNNYYNANRGTYAGLQNLSGPVKWLNQNTSAEDVILTDSVMSHSYVFIRTLLLYTKNYHYLGFEVHSMLPREELEDRILYAMRFFGYSQKDAEEVFKNSAGILFFGLSANYAIARDEEISDYISKLSMRYSALAGTEPLSLLKKYRINYVLIGEKDRMFGAIEKMHPLLKKVYDDGRYKILKIGR